MASMQVHVLAYTTVIVNTDAVMHLDLLNGGMSSSSLALQICLMTSCSGAAQN